MVSCNDCVGTVTTGAAGSSATVTNSGQVLPPRLILQFLVAIQEQQEQQDLQALQVRRVQTVVMELTVLMEQLQRLQLERSSTGAAIRWLRQ